MEKMVEMNQLMEQLEEREEIYVIVRGITFRDIEMLLSIHLCNSEVTVKTIEDKLHFYIQFNHPSLSKYIHETICFLLVLNFLNFFDNVFFKTRLL